MSTDQPENELNDLTIARLKRNQRNFPIVATNGCIDGVVFGEACINEYMEAVMDECYEDENEVWHEASKIAGERDAAKREVANLKQRGANLEAVLRYIAKVTCVYDSDDARDVYHVVKAAPQGTNMSIQADLFPLIDTPRQDTAVAWWPNRQGIDTRACQEINVSFALGRDVVLTIEATADGIDWVDCTREFADAPKYTFGNTKYRGTGSIGVYRPAYQAIRCRTTVQGKSAKMHRAAYKVLDMTPKWAKQYCGGAVIALNNKVIDAVTRLYGSADTAVRVYVQRIIY